MPVLPRRAAAQMHAAGAGRIMVWIPGRGTLGPLVLSQAKASYFYKSPLRFPSPDPAPPNPEMKGENFFHNILPQPLLTTFIPSSFLFGDKQFFRKPVGMGQAFLFAWPMSTGELNPKQVRTMPLRFPSPAPPTWRFWFAATRPGFWPGCKYQTTPTSYGYNRCPGPRAYCSLSGCDPRPAKVQ